MKRKGSALEKKKPKYSRQNASGNLNKRRRGVTIQPEMKFNDVTFATAATTTPTVVSLTNFAAGDTALLRDGNKIATKSLNFRMQVANEALTQSNTVRCVVVVDKQPNGAAPTYSGSVVTSVFDAATVVAQRQVSTASRFHILKDDTFVVNQEGSTGGALSQAFWQCYLKIAEKYQLCTFGDSAAGEPISNALYLMYIGSTASGATDTTVTGTARLRFFG